jgi:hypothetical protein
MPDLAVAVEGATSVPFSAVPMLAFKLRVANSNPDEPIHTVFLRCQIQIEATRRRYSPEDQARLRDLFGEPERWGRTLRNLHWTNACVVIPRFTGVATAELQVPCTFDFNVAATKYFGGLKNGDIPLCLMFSGTVFYADPEGALQAAPIAWDREAKFRLPVAAWREMMDHYYPDSAWLNLRRDIFEELSRFKMERGIPTWERTFEIMLAMAKEEGVPQ